MTTAEKFKVWLETIYISEKTKKSLTTGKPYVSGINTLNNKVGVDIGVDIYDIETNLNPIRDLVDKPEYFHKDRSSHLNAFIKFRDYESDKKRNNPLQRKTDVFKKQQVEKSAVETTIKYFENLDYTVISKENDNLGWDLEATNIKETLLLEVKGLSGNIASIELTPNEYQNSKDRKTQYKLCIVTNALTKPKLEIFSFDTNKDCWVNELNEKLATIEIIAVRMWKE